MLHHPFARLTADRRSSHCFHNFRVSRYAQLRIEKDVMIEVEVEMRILMEMEIKLKIERKMEVLMELK